MYKRTCVQCGIGFDARRSCDKFCRSSCAVIRGRELYRSKRRFPDLAKSVIGSIHELEIAVDLLARGLDVYRSLTPCNGSDLVAVQGDQMWRVECTTGQKLAGGEGRNPKVSRDGTKRVGKPAFDLLAVVYQDGQIEYFPKNVLPPRGDNGDK